MKAIYFGIIAFVLGLVVELEGCSCMPSHPQTQYCAADYVILARVRRQKTNRFTRFYKIQLRKSYKMSEKAFVALKAGLIQTAVHSSMCGVDLDVGKTYVLSGRIYSLKAYINTCNFIERWRDLSRVQRKGFKRSYSIGCECDISSNRLHPPTRNICQTTGNCHVKHGVCLRQRHGTCMWNRNRVLQQCLKPPLTN